MRNTGMTFCLVVCCCVVAAGCGSNPPGPPGKPSASSETSGKPAKEPITNELYKKVLGEKMTVEQINALLGPGREEKRPTTPPDMKEMIWEDGKGNSIFIQFKDGKAQGGKSTIRTNN